VNRIALACVVVGILACGRFRRPTIDTGDDPARQIAEANDLARSGSPGAARSLYRKVLREQRGTPAAAEALWGLGQLYVDPDAGLRDYSAARIAFGRIVSDYRDSRHAAEARAWYVALGELLQGQAESRRLRTDLDRLKALDMEQERPR
jgi:hypothetical protein